MPTWAESFATELAGAKPQDEKYAPRVVSLLLSAARDAQASDIHLIPREEGRLEMLWRIDGVLHQVAEFDQAGQNIVSRLKVLAELLTYKSDVPQEGRIRLQVTPTSDATPATKTNGPPPIEMRVSTFPTLFGEKAVVRLFVASGNYRTLEELSFPLEVLSGVQELLGRTSGLFLVTGPAGSGKTTTLYACLRELLNATDSPRSVCTLEDPIEAVLEHAAQSQIRTAAGFDYPTGLKSLMRQDPEVVMVGEIRDLTTAETVFQLALTGCLVLSSFHAGRAAEAVSRLTDMGIESYLLRSSLLGILHQRLVRRLCECAEPLLKPEERLGFDVPQAWGAKGCTNCRQTGYQGRLVLTELLRPDLEGLGRAILSRRDAEEIERLAISSGFVTTHARGLTALSNRQTSPSELRRVLGKS